MSKLEELIQELCPDGVEYKAIKDIAWTGIGLATSVTKHKRNDGVVLIHNSDIRQNKITLKSFEFLDEDFVKKNENKIHRLHDIVTVHTGDVGTSAVIEQEFVGSIGFTTIITRIKDFSKVSPYYLCNYLNSQLFKSEVRKKSISERSNLNQKDYEVIQVPIPPLEIQKEIVRLLDDFTAKTTELQADLNKEYEARKKQYEYYRDTLLNCDTKIPKVKLGEFAEISRGGNFQKKDFAENGFPCIHYDQIYTHYGTYADTTLTTINEEAYNKSKKAKKNDIVMAVTSENIEDVCKSVAWLGDKDIAVSGHTAIISHHQNAKYLSYYFSSNAFFKQKKKLAHGAKVIEVTPNTLANIEVPLPSLEVQNRLVEVLDNFDSICSDLNISLPAEIEARQKQYEYYRDLLLTFTETGSIMPQTDRQAIIRLIQYVFGYISIELGSIATVTKLAGYEFTKYVTYSDEGNIIALRGLNVKNGKIDLNDIKYIDKSDFSKLKRSKLQCGDMLFTYVGTIGQVAIVDKNDKYYLAPNVALIRADKSIVNPEYMRYFFQTSVFFEKQINRLLQSSSMKNIPMEKIRKFVLQLPSMDEQNHIVRILKNFDSICNDLQSDLPAEIESRQKQYEFYRDKLLTFKELNESEVN